MDNVEVLNNIIMESATESPRNILYKTKAEGKKIKREQKVNKDRRERRRFGRNKKNRLLRK